MRIKGAFRRTIERVSMKRKSKSKKIQAELVVKNLQVVDIFSHQQTTVIGSDAVMTGELKVSGRLLVQGKFSGKISEGLRGSSVFVDSNAVVRGKMDSSISVVRGTVDGDLSSAYLVVDNSANLNGSIQYERMKSSGGFGCVHIKRNKALIPLVDDAEALLLMEDRSEESGGRYE